MIRSTYRKTFFKKGKHMASIKDVASRAGVSISTVSNVINGKKYVSAELTQKVLQAIDELNYEVDLIARSLKNNRTMTIGVIITSLNRIFIPQVLNGLQQGAEAYGYHMLIYATNENIELEKKYLQILINSKVDGIIIDTVADVADEPYYQQLARLEKGSKKIPVVSIERDLSRYSICSIYADNVKSAFRATSHLIESGCSKILHISGPQVIEMVLCRTKGYQEALREHGLTVSPMYAAEGDFSPLSGYRVVKQMVNDGVEFDGIFADNDQMAIGAIKALKEYEFKIPEHIKLVGFDNTFVSSIVKPSLSTINVPKYRMGWLAAENLCRMIEEEIGRNDRGNYSVELTTNLMVRESTCGMNMENWDLEGW